jgi:riboflavin transporter FmnP
VSEEEHSAVLHFTFHVLPFTVLESGFFSIVSGVCYTRAVKRILARTEGHADETI